MLTWSPGRLRNPGRPRWLGGEDEGCPAPRAPGITTAKTDQELDETHTGHGSGGGMVGCEADGRQLIAVAAARSNATTTRSSFRASHRDDGRRHRRAAQRERRQGDGAADSGRPRERSPLALVGAAQRAARGRSSATWAGVTCPR